MARLWVDLDTGMTHAKQAQVSSTTVELRGNAYFAWCRRPSDDAVRRWYGNRVAPPRDCPCHSMLRYAACCGPIHAGTRKAETPEALMRSRYAAFALGLGEYLVETLASTHSDVADLANVESPRQELVRALSRARERQRFLALRILHKEETDGGKRGEVLFFARIFERGQDVSFAELSSFVRENGAWRYAEGVLVPGEKLPRDGEGLTRGLFLELAHAEGG